MPPTQLMTLWTLIKVSSERSVRSRYPKTQLTNTSITAGTIPEPADLVQSIRKGRISLPPRATSPIKTYLNSPPRRSMPQSVEPMSSSPRNMNNGTHTRATSHPPATKPVNRRLDFSPGKLRESVEKSPPRAPSSKLRKGKLASTSLKGKGKGKRVFDLTGGGDDIEESETEGVNQTSTANGILFNEDSNILNGDDEIMVESTIDQEMQEEENSQNQPPDFPEEDSQVMGPPTTSGAKEHNGRRGRAPTSTTVDPDVSQVSVLEPEQKRRGRPPGLTKTRIHQDPDVSLAAPTSPERTDRRNPPPSLRDPNVRSKVSKGSKGRPPSRAPSVASTSRFIQRSQTPANDSSAHITRYGRQSIKPLASWRGEKTIMGDRTCDSLPGIQDVVRVEEVIEPRPKQHRSYQRRPYRAKSRLGDVDEKEEEEEERAHWEIDPGIMVAQVMDWDPNTNKYDEASTRDEGMAAVDFPVHIEFVLTLPDIAYSHEAIEMRDINGAEFKFAKTLTLDFFGSGMVHLPPGGFKRIKNSRKMQMVFFVFYGRVTVSIGTPPTKFSIGKGGQWQVPRGKFSHLVLPVPIAVTVVLSPSSELRCGNTSHFKWVTKLHLTQ